jgi:hypothetical protein
MQKRYKSEEKNLFMCMLIRELLKSMKKMTHVYDYSAEGHI